MLQTKLLSLYPSMHQNNICPINLWAIAHLVCSQGICLKPQGKTDGPVDCSAEAVERDKVVSASRITGRRRVSG